MLPAAPRRTRRLAPHSLCGTGRQGPVIEQAYTVEDGRRYEIGWVFRAPADLDLGVDPADLELVAIPLPTDPESGEDVSMFVYQARLEADFMATMAAHDVNVTVITAGQDADRHLDPSAAAG
ncbi:MAG: hypothetical protein H0T54_10055 [Geodermatophilaceae bacterium]|nr:hypothetical protein [Geodermatophilaceae bacterium]